MQIEAIISFAIYICVEMRCFLRIYLKILLYMNFSTQDLDYFLYRSVDLTNQDRLEFRFSNDYYNRIILS